MFNHNPLYSHYIGDPAGDLSISHRLPYKDPAGENNQDNSGDLVRDPAGDPLTYSFLAYPAGDNSGDHYMILQGIRPEKNRDIPAGILQGIPWSYLKLITNKILEPTQHFYNNRFIRTIYIIILLLEPEIYNRKYINPPIIIGSRSRY